MSVRGRPGLRVALRQGQCGLEGVGAGGAGGLGDAELVLQALELLVTDLQVGQLLLGGGEVGDAVLGAVC
jgi:hypothetical protein